MEIEMNTARGEVIVRGADGGTVCVREYCVGDFTGNLSDGETMTFADGCTATRRGELVVWTEPAGQKTK